MNQASKVIVVDRHALVRAGLCCILAAAADIEVVGTAGDGSGAVELATKFKPNLVILDATIPRVEDTTRQLVKVKPGLEVLILALDCAVQQALRLLGAGATGYLCKNAAPDDLANAVRHASRGEMVLGPAVARGVIDQLTHAAPRVVGAGDELRQLLTEREMGVLRRLCQGDTDKQIAHELRISIRTVHGHLRHIYAKLGVRSRTEAMHLALERGWVTLAIACFFISNILGKIAT